MEYVLASIAGLLQNLGNYYLTVERAASWVSYVISPARHLPYY
jgi:hypothetical protein